jgi:hypothetical protein
VFDTLSELGVLKMSKTKWERILLRAEARDRATLANPKGRQEQNAFSKLLSNYDNQNNTNAINLIAKELALTYFIAESRLKKVNLSQKLVGSTHF